LRGKPEFVGKALNFPLQVKVLDPLNNPMAGVQVSFVVLGGGNFNGSGVTTVTSDSLSIASAEWTLGAEAGPVVWNGRDQQGKPAPSGIYH
jgi:hypothetical protein